MEALNARGFEAIPRDSVAVESRTIHRLPALLRNGQHAFTATGGLHAAALFDAAGSLLSLREDVGRHNALDKLIGAELLVGRTPLHSRIVLVSGRASFELVQKCLAAGVSVLAAVGAPSSLAVDLAREFDLTLLGFVREARFNIYSGSGESKMKLRMRGNTVRLRLTQSEVAKFDETGSVEETVEFPSGSLVYRLRRGSDYFADFNGGTLTVTVPERHARLWTASSQVGMEARAGTVDLLIEKDFQCVHGPSDADSFPPNG